MHFYKLLLLKQPTLLIFISEMSNPIQQNDKTMMNMYSVHKFYEEIVAEMHQIMTSDKKERYLLKEWDDKKAMLFNHAVKYYLNNQPSFFNEALQKYSNNQVQSIIPFKRKKRKNSTFNGTQKSVVSMKSKNDKKEYSSIAAASTQQSKKQNGSSVKQNQNLKQQVAASIKSGVSDAFSNQAQNLKTQQTEEKKAESLQRNEPIKLKKEQKFEDDMSDDLEKFAAEQNNQNFTHIIAPAETKTEEDRKSVRSGSFYYQEQEAEESSDQQSLGKYVQRASKKTNALIFGNFSTRLLRRKAKQEKIDLQMTNCFVKMFKNGRDAFFQRLTLSLFKRQKHQAPT